MPVPLTTAASAQEGAVEGEVGEASGGVCDELEHSRGGRR